MSERYLHADAGRVRYDIARLLEAYPELAEDDDLRADMLEGETAFDDMLDRLYLTMRQREALAVGARLTRDDLAIRIARHEAAAKRLKAMMLELMETAGETKRQTVLASYSVTEPKPRADVFEPAELPQGFTRIKVEPAKAEILKALMAGEDVPGASLALGDASLTVRSR